MSKQKWIGEDGPQEIWVFLDQGTNVTGYSETGPELARRNERAVHFTRAPQWQPIETAPKDGTEILAWDGQGQATISWSNGCWSLVYAGWRAEDGEFDGAINWQPLPAPPEVSE